MGIEAAFEEVKEEVKTNLTQAGLGQTVPRPTRDRPEVWAKLGWLRSQRQDWTGAVSCYRQAVALCPTNARLHFNLAVVLDRQGDSEAAIQSYRQAIALQPQYVEAYSNLGCVLVKQNQIEAAIQIYQQALTFYPKWATLHNNLGQAWLAQGNLESAIAAYRRALQLQPNLALAHHNLGIAWQQQQQYEAAAACFEQAIALNPDHQAAYGDCGNALLAQGQWQQAMVYFRQAIAPHADWIAAYCDWADRLTESDRLSQARMACSRFLRSLQQQPDHPDTGNFLAETCRHLGDALAEYGNFQQAEAYYYRALQFQPQALELYLRLGHCLVQQQRSNAAIWVYHLALANHPHHPQLYLQLGEALEHQQQFEAAIDYYDRVWQQGSEGLGLRDRGLEQNLSFRQQAVDAPQGIYQTTWDWIAAAQLDDRHYLSQSQPAQPNPFPIPHATSTLRPACLGLNCPPCLKQILKQFQQTHQQVGVRVECPQPIATPSLPTFVATVPHGRAWAVPQQNWWQECRSIAVITPDNYLLADVSRDYPGQLPGCQNPNPHQHCVFTATLPPIESIEGTIAVLSGLSAQVYFHWMVDILPRLELLRQNGIDWAAIDGFWVNSIQRPFQRETLQALGIPLDKIIESDRHPHIQATQLVVPSFAGHLGWLEPWALQFLRHKFLPQQTEPSNYPDRIYITRSRARHRRVLNEAELIEPLHELGFVCVELESLSVAAQVALFAHARVIVAPHGSGLTNLIFCQPETTVIEFVSPHYIGHYYWVISQQLGLTHYYLAGESFDCHPIRQLMYQNPLTEDLWVNPRSLVTLLKDVLAQSC